MDLTTEQRKTSFMLRMAYKYFITAVHLHWLKYMCARIYWMERSPLIYSENHSAAIPHTSTSQQISAVWDYIIGKWDWWQMWHCWKVLAHSPGARCCWFTVILKYELINWHSGHHEKHCRWHIMTVRPAAGWTIHKSDYWPWGIRMTSCHTLYGKWIKRTGGSYKISYWILPFDKRKLVALHQGYDLISIYTVIHTHIFSVFQWK